MIVATSSPGVRIVDRYVLLERRGKGGFGEVWRAKDRNIDGEVGRWSSPATGRCCSSSSGLGHDTDERRPQRRREGIGYASGPSWNFAKRFRMSGSGVASARSQATM